MIKTTKKLKKAVTPKAAKTVKANPETRVCLELVNPQAREVFVAGTFNNWKPETAPMKASGKGRWVKEINVTPGRYEYLFVVDGQWFTDPNAKENVNNPFGGRNSVLSVAAGN